MDFIIKNLQQNIVNASRAIGYLIIDNSNGQYNMVRKLHGDSYPRFHIYATLRPGSGQEQGADFIFSLHLDQKKPVYEGTHAHNGEYFGPVVESEADRVKEILYGQNQ